MSGIVKDLNKKTKVMEELFWQRGIAKKNKGAIEVQTPVGNIDVLCDHALYEVKHIRQWKHALGQVLAYGYFHPSKEKRLYLFGVATKKLQTKIETICNFYDVHVLFTDFTDEGLTKNESDDLVRAVRKMAAEKAEVGLK